MAYKSKEKANEYAKLWMRRFRKRFPAFVREYEKEYRHANRATMRAIDKRARDKIRLKVLKYYGGTPPKCKCCGETQYEFLSIDHIKGGGSKERKEHGSKFCYVLIRRGFPKGYQILCHNCNQAKGYYGRCPHRKGSHRT